MKKQRRDDRNKAQDSKTQDHEDRKIGQGSLAAMVRLGHKETAQILPAFPGPMRVIEEPGTFNNPTFTEVGKQRGTIHTADAENGKQPSTSKDRTNPPGGEYQIQKDWHEPDHEPEME